MILSSRLKWFLILLVLTPVFTVEASAKGDDEVSDSTVHLLLPFVSFNSDLGFVGGGAWDRYLYSDTIQPYGNLTMGRFQASTQGRFLVRFTHDRLNFLNSRFRIKGTIRINRLLNDNYFGLGNNTELKDDLLDKDFYKYESRTGRLRFRARYPLKPRSEQQLDLLLFAQARYFRAVELGESEQVLGSKLFQDNNIRDENRAPWAGFLGAGLLWDNRDKEIDTKKGTFAEILLKGSPSFFSTSDPLLNVTADLRAFYNIPALGDLVFGGRLGMEYMEGNAPFWLLPSLGGESNLRGYHLRRFRDDGIFYNSFIVRRWFVSFDWIDLKLGAQAITEGGRTFGRYSDDNFFDNHKRSYGGGLLISAFTKDFIVRVDYVESNETERIYLNLGFVF